MRKRLLLLPVISLVLGGCSSIPFLNKAAQNVSKSAEEKVAEQAILADCKFDNDACKYMASAMTMMSKPLIMKSSTDVKDYGKQESQTIMDGKGNMQMIGMKDGVEDSNMISLDGETYVKDYEKKVWMWYKADKGGETSSLFDPQKITEDFKEKFVEENKDDYVMNKLGTENCGEAAPALTCFKYESYMSKSPTDKTITWFDTKNHLARRMDSNYGGTTSSVLYIYDNVPQIVKPSPIQEFEMPKIPEGATGQMPTQADIDALMKQYSEGNE
jgi:hypothetical protein